MAGFAQHPLNVGEIIGRNETPTADNWAAAVVETTSVKQIRDQARRDTFLSRHLGYGEVLHGFASGGWRWPSTRPYHFRQQIALS
jgi:hypothetical protein